jgi:uncharacterized ion transporter superfamily protein YfcC
MLGFILVATLLTYVIPQGSYERITDSVTDKTTVVPDSYQTIEAPPVSFFDMLMSVPEGIISRADLITLILLLGGCFYVIEKTGALKDGVTYLTTLLIGKEQLAIHIVSLAFLFGGISVGLQEEIIAMIPVIMFLCAKLGYNSYVAVACSYGTAVLGAAFSPINPFAVVLAQNEVGLPFLSGLEFRIIVLIIAYSIWMFMLMRYAGKNKVEKSADDSEVLKEIPKRSLLILVLLVLTFGVVIYGMLYKKWGFNEMTAVFFLLGLLAGLIGKLGINKTAEMYNEGFSLLIFAGIIIGLASSISIILEKGMIIDTIIYGLFQPMQHLPKEVAAVSMMTSQSALHFVVASYSGQAILTMPILAPLSDLIGISRQVCVLAYQYGAVMTDLFIPTNGALMAVLAIAGIDFNKWFKFMLKLGFVIFVVASIAIVVAVKIGLQ